MFASVTRKGYPITHNVFVHCTKPRFIEKNLGVIHFGPFERLNIKTFQQNHASLLKRERPFKQYLYRQIDQIRKYLVHVTPGHCLNVWSSLQVLEAWYPPNRNVYHLWKFAHVQIAQIKQDTIFDLSTHELKIDCFHWKCSLCIVSIVRKHICLYSTTRRCMAYIHK